MERLTWRGPNHHEGAHSPVIADRIGRKFEATKNTAVQIIIFSSAFAVLTGSLLEKRRAKKRLDPQELLNDINRLAFDGHNRPHRRGQVLSPHIHSYATGGKGLGRGKSKMT